jgi:hypothetical protein
MALKRAAVAIHPRDEIKELVEMHRPGAHPMLLRSWTCTSCWTAARKESKPTHRNSIDPPATFLYHTADATAIPG